MSGKEAAAREANSANLLPDLGSQGSSCIQALRARRLVCYEAVGFSHSNARAKQAKLDRAITPRMPFVSGAIMCQ